MKKFVFLLVVLVFTMLIMTLSAAILGAPPVWPQYVPVALAFVVYTLVIEGLRKRFLP